MAMGQWQWGNWSNGNDRSLPLRSIDRVGVGVGVGHGRGRFIPCVLIEKVSECPNGRPIKGVTYLVDYFD
jgi:hypothetical protein